MHATACQHPHRIAVLLTFAALLLAGVERSLLAGQGQGALDPACGRRDAARQIVEQPLPSCAAALR